MKMVDRLTGKPLHIDISDLPMKRGVTTNRNKFVLGPSGSGKSFFMNHFVRQYHEQGSHIVIVDTGNSYQGLCEMINRKTHGEDGIYYTYTDENPISFNRSSRKTRCSTSRNGRASKPCCSRCGKRTTSQPPVRRR